MILEIQLVLGLLVAVAALSFAAQKSRLPAPILLVIGGLLLGLIPGIPEIHLEPDLVFLLFLPPLLYPAAALTSWRDFRANLRPIILLAVGLVLFTTCAVGWLAPLFVTGMPIATAFVLGAIISPPDAVAATAITQRLRVPRRIVTVLEGESLVNDASALVAYRFAVAAVVTGTFSLASASAQFFIMGIGGILLGLVVGWVSAWILAWLDDPPIQITVSILAPFAAYLWAESWHVSGVLAVVVAGLHLGRRLPEIGSSRLRLRAAPFWDMIVFLLNGFIFLLIGLQLPGIMHALGGHTNMELLRSATILSLLVIIVRIFWVYAASYLPRYLFKSIREKDPYPSWRNVAIVAWTGMRGVVSLAAAFALPVSVADGTPFPARNLVLYFTFAIILVTLVFQGLTLPWIIRTLGVMDDGEAAREEREARLKANQAALVRLGELNADGKVQPELMQRLRVEYDDRIRQLEVCEEAEDTEHAGPPPASYMQLQHEALKVERQTIIRLRNEQVINDEVMRRIERDLDLAEVRLKRERD